MVAEDEIRSGIQQTTSTARLENPLVGSITNAVSMNFVANAQLAVGGSAAIVYLADEAVDLAQAGESFYVNMGTLMPLHEQSIPHVAKTMHELCKPMILDPVGLGIGKLRTNILQNIKPFKPTIIRGNASEIIALAGLWGIEGKADDSKRAHGVDSTDSVEEATGAAVALARFTKGVVAVSGESDLVTDGRIIAVSEGGSPLMKNITGSGCSQGGVIAVYAAVASPFVATLAGVQVYNLAGRRAAEKTFAPASFQIAFLDELYQAKPTNIGGNPFTIREA